MSTSDEFQPILPKPLQLLRSSDTPHSKTALTKTLRRMPPRAHPPSEAVELGAKAGPLGIRIGMHGPLDVYQSSVCTHTQCTHLCMCVYIHVRGKLGGRRPGFNVRRTHTYIHNTYIGTYGASVNTPPTPQTQILLSQSTAGRPKLRPAISGTPWPCYCYFVWASGAWRLGPSCGVRLSIYRACRTARAEDACASRRRHRRWRWGGVVGRRLASSNRLPRKWSRYFTRQCLRT